MNLYMVTISKLTTLHLSASNGFCFWQVSDIGINSKVLIYYSVNKIVHQKRPIYRSFFQHFLIGCHDDWVMDGLCGCNEWSGYPAMHVIFFSRLTKIANETYRWNTCSISKKNFSWKFGIICWFLGKSDICSTNR